MKTDQFIPLEPDKTSFYRGDGGWRFLYRKEGDLFIILIPIDLYDWIKRDTPNNIMVSNKPFYSMARNKTKCQKTAIENLSWQEYYNGWFAYMGFSKTMGVNLINAYTSGNGYYPYL